MNSTLANELRSISEHARRTQLETEQARQQELVDQKTAAYESARQQEILSAQLIVPTLPDTLRTAAKGGPTAAIIFAFEEDCFCRGNKPLVRNWDPSKGNPITGSDDNGTGLFGGWSVRGCDEAYLLEDSAAKIAYDACKALKLDTKIVYAYWDDCGDWKSQYAIIVSW